jgi:hypothetical protein
MLPKVTTDNSVLRRGSGRLSPPDADRERARPAFQKALNFL